MIPRKRRTNWTNSSSLYSPTKIQYSRICFPTHHPTQLPRKLMEEILTSHIMHHGKCCTTCNTDFEKSHPEGPSCYSSGMTSFRTCPTEPKQTSLSWTLQRHSTSWDTGNSCGNSTTTVSARRCSSGYKASCLTGWREIVCGGRCLRSTTMLSTRTLPVPLLHQWHPCWPAINCEADCRWHNHLPDSNISQRCQDPTARLWGWLQMTQSPTW